VTALEIPDEVVRMNVSANGAAGRAWLGSLPGLVEELTDRWSLTIGPAFTGGAVGFVAPAERLGGERLVLKVSFVDEETRHEPDALRLWDGDGAVRLVDADPARGALLLERLEPGTPLADHPDRSEAIGIACSLLKRLWRPLPDGHPFPLVRDLASRLADELPGRFDRQDRPFDERLLRRAVDLCRGLAVSSEEAVLANRDFHLWNVLAAERESWLVIDPKPLVGERAFDTGHLLRTLLPERLDLGSVDTIVGRLAKELELEPAHVRRWAFVRSVDDALWGLSVGGTDVGWDVRCAHLLAERL
jgi:streptomycin 6-kinase